MEELEQQSEQSPVSPIPVRKTLGYSDMKKPKFQSPDTRISKPLIVPRKVEDGSSFLEMIKSAPEQEVEDHYDLDEVIDRMLGKRDRKIPGSVYKMHSPSLTLMQSAALGQPKPSARVFFTYPKYCFMQETKVSEALQIDQQ